VVIYIYIRGGGFMLWKCNQTNRHIEKGEEVRVMGIISM
jgi:hypothetical protein